MSRIQFNRRDLSWKEIGEDFVRWEIVTPIGCFLLHRMDAPIEHTHYHDHPWNFWSIVLWGGYLEKIRGGITEWRGLFSIRYRPAETAHKTTTFQTGVSWSICFTGPRIRQWNGHIAE